MRFIGTPKLFTGYSDKVIDDAVLVIGDDGFITEILSKHDLDPQKVLFINGAILPGFINAHCHLELSYMKGYIEEATGLHNFILDVERQKKRLTIDREMAITGALLECERNGIVLIGDICNTGDTIEFKAKSSLRFVNFIELYAFNPDRALQVFENGLTLLDDFERINHNSKSFIVPHAPYSCSEKLFGLIASQNQGQGIISIHNQESADENSFFINKSGKIVDRLTAFGIPFDNWVPPGKTSLQYYLPLIQSAGKIILVHNTFSSKEDIDFALAQNMNLFWCLCPNANWYIERKLPDMQLLTDSNLRIVLGTDSLASNHELSIWSEMKRVKENFPNIPDEVLVQWATINGAEALGYSDKFGTLLPGREAVMNEVQLDENGNLDFLQPVNPIRGPHWKSA